MRSRTDLSTDLRSISDRSHLSDLSVNGALVSFNRKDDCHPSLSLYSFTNNGRSLTCTAWSLRLLEGTMQLLFVLLIFLS